MSHDFLYELPPLFPDLLLCQVKIHRNLFTENVEFVSVSLQVSNTGAGRHISFIVKNPSACWDNLYINNIRKGTAFVFKHIYLINSTSNRPVDQNESIMCPAAFSEAAK